jgi:thiamine biosynthesis protein ThiS
MVQDTKTIEIELNGARLEIERGLTIAALLEQRGIERRMVAVELNGEIVPRYEFDETPVSDGDRLELLQMVGGG